MLDHLIKGGTVIDGTGTEGVVADVGIEDGCITEMGKIESPAKQTHDADGLVVCPGFIDPHTHYDAQLFWDPYATPSNIHGVTTSLNGNCGFTLAPINGNEDADYIRKMMAQVEGMPLTALENGLDWEWQSFGDYLDLLSGNLGINSGFLVGHSAIRRHVMGDESVGQEASQEQIEAMVSLLQECIRAGGLGFSTSMAYTHSDGDGQPIPSRWASNEELIALAGAVKEYPGTTLEFITDGCLDRFSDEEMQLMTDLSLAANRPLNWNVLTVDAKHSDRVAQQMGLGAYAAERGGKVVALTMPTLVGMNMSFGFYCALNRLPDWEETLTLPIKERIQKLSEPGVREFLHERSQAPEAGVFLRLTGWDSYRIGDVFSKENEGLSGRTVAEIDRERGGSGRGLDAFNTLCDIVVADKCKTILWPHPTDDDPDSWALRAELWDDENVLIGGSDAGAHLDRMCGAPYTTEWLGDTLRGRKLTTVESAISKITDVPARLFGLTGRGRVQKDYVADLVVFDPETIDSDRIVIANDLPGGEKRLHADSIGVHKVFLGGVVSVEDGKAIGVKAGKIIRSGQDTESVTVPGAS